MGNLVAMVRATATMGNVRHFSNTARDCGDQVLVFTYIKYIANDVSYTRNGKLDLSIIY